MSEISMLDKPISFLREGLLGIGYANEMFRVDYDFDNAFGESTIPLQAKLAVFGQEPVSSRNSCFGAVEIKNNVAQTLEEYKSLGAPILALIHPGGEWIDIWNIAQSPPIPVASVPSPEIVAVIEAHKHEWEPNAILRAKAIRPDLESRQLDFYDFGLIPELESAIYKKLDELLNRVLTTAKKLYKQSNGRDLNTEEYQGLFRLVFRLVAAKILGDRGHEGANWLNSDSDYIVQEVTNFYFPDSYNEGILNDQKIRQELWDIIRGSFNFQNISVEAIANTYETTWITEQIREEYSTHATPYKIAEYIVRTLPFDQLSLEERTVFEPFCGHAPFLIAALGRLRELLPRDLNPTQQHNYFKRMLTGMDKDAVAKEFATVSLMIADYPNPNGWNIENSDVFTSPNFDIHLKNANIVLCNPPYEKFNKKKITYSENMQNNQAVEALKRVLKYPPKMLGFVLPRVFVEGNLYRQERKQLAELYNTIEVVALPDSTFLFSEAYTVLLIAYNGRSRRVSAEVMDTKWDKKWFLEAGIPSWTKEVPVQLAMNKDNPCFWYTPIDDVLKSLNSLPRLGNYVEVHRGIRHLSLKGNRNNLIKKNPSNEFYKEGLAKIGDSFEPYIIGETEFLNTSDEVKNKRGGGWNWLYENPKVIVNAARNSRGVWRITGVLDLRGLYFTQQLIGIWPKEGNNLPIEVIAALINNPVINALLYSKSYSLPNNEITTIKDEIPVPNFTESQKQAIISLTREYISFRQEWLKTPDNNELENMCQKLINRIDGHVLAAYNLKPSLEKQLLDYFGNDKRPGPVGLISSKLLPTIKPYKALIRIKKIKGVGESAEKIIEAEILSWDPHKVVRLPYSSVPQDLQNKLDRNVMLIANVNIGAQSASEIFMENIELAAEPDEQSYN